MMSFWRKIEDRPTPKEVYNLRVYLYAAVAAAGAATIGYDSAFIGGTFALQSFRTEFGFDNMSTSSVNTISANIVSCYQAGAFFGAFLAYFAGHYLGRRTGIVIFSLLFLLGGGVMLGASGAQGLNYLYGGRVVAGLGIGGTSNLIPIYISELSPPAIRGRLVGMWEIGWQIGGLVGFWIDVSLHPMRVLVLLTIARQYGVSNNLPSSHKQWFIPYAIQLIPGGLFTAGAIWLVESPRWLIYSGYREEGIASLAKIRGLDRNHVYVQEELAQIDHGIDLRRTSIGMGLMAPFKEIFRNKKVMYRLFLGGSLFFWQNGSGINAINYYSPTVFKAIGITGANTSLLTTGIFGVIKTTITFVWIVLLIDRLGRRRLLMWGAFGGSLCMWVVGGYIAGAKPQEHPAPRLTAGGIAAMVFFYLWTAFYTPSWNGTPWVVNSEMFDQNIRTLAQAFAAANNWFWNFIVARFTPQMFAKMGAGVWFFFATMQLLSIPFVFFLLPETKSVPLEQMDQLFDRSLAPRLAHETVMANLQLIVDESSDGTASGGGEGKDIYAK